MFAKLDRNSKVSFYVAENFILTDKCLAVTAKISMFILRLHYLPGSPVCSKRSVPWNFGQIFLCFQDLLRLVKFSYVALRYP